MARDRAGTTYSTAGNRRSQKGGHGAEIQALVARERLQGRVIFTGPVAGENKRELLAGSDFRAASHQEGDSVAVK